MSVAKLSSKGQLIIPKHVRDAHCWDTGQELEVVDTKDGVLLVSRNPFPATSLEDLKQLSKYTGATKSLDDMEEAIREASKAHNV